MVRHSPKHTVVQAKLSHAPGFSASEGDFAKRLGAERRLLLGALQGCPFVCHCLGAFNEPHALWLVFELCPGGALASTLDALVLPQPHDRRTEAHARQQTHAAFGLTSGDRESLAAHPAVAKELAAALEAAEASEAGHRAVDDATGQPVGPWARQWSFTDDADGASLGPRAIWRRQRRSARGSPPRLALREEEKNTFRRPPGPLPCLAVYQSPLKQRLVT